MGERQGGISGWFEKSLEPPHGWAGLGCWPPPRHGAASCSQEEAAPCWHLVAASTGISQPVRPSTRPTTSLLGVSSGLGPGLAYQPCPALRVCPGPASLQLAGRPSCCPATSLPHPLSSNPACFILFPRHAMQCMSQRGVCVRYFSCTSCTATTDLSSAAVHLIQTVLLTCGAVVPRKDGGGGRLAALNQCVQAVEAQDQNILYGWVVHGVEGLFPPVEAPLPHTPTYTNPPPATLPVSCLLPWGLQMCGSSMLSHAPTSRSSSGSCPTRCVRRCPGSSTASC